MKVYFVEVQDEFETDLSPDLLSKLFWASRSKNMTGMIRVVYEKRKVTYMGIDAIDPDRTFTREIMANIADPYTHVPEY